MHVPSLFECFQCPLLKSVNNLRFFMYQTYSQVPNKWEGGPNRLGVGKIPKVTKRGGGSEFENWL